MILVGVGSHLSFRPDRPRILHGRQLQAPIRFLIIENNKRRSADKFVNQEYNVLPAPSELGFREQFVPDSFEFHLLRCDKPLLENIPHHMPSLVSC